MKYIKLFSNCHVVKGASRALIFDSQRKEHYLVPLSLIDFLNDVEGKLIEEYKNTLTDADKIIINEYLDFLLSNNLIQHFNSRSTLACFPPMDLQWDFPAYLTNAIVLIHESQTVEDYRLFQGDLFVHTVQFISTERILKIDQLRDILECVNKCNLNTTQLIFNNTKKLQEEELVSLFSFCKKLEIVIALNSDYNKVVDIPFSKIIFSTDREYKPIHCGNVFPQYFNYELNHFTESQKYNTCLNRKISIGENGEIKNCPGMTTTYGNFRETNMSEILETAGFKDFWAVTKDQISKCQDCEFRHICTDCRAYRDNPQDIYSAPLKCGYDPYTCDWAEWSINPLKKSAITYYGMSELLGQ